MLLLLLSPALAQTPPFDGQLFRPSADSEATLWTEDTHTAPDGYASARTYFQYARAPVRWTGADGDSERLVSDLVGIDAVGAARWRSIRMGVHLPVYLLASGQVDEAEPGLGDVAFDLKGTLLDRKDFPVGVAVMGRIMLPTSSVNVPLGAGGTSWELMAIADKRFGPVTVAANLGTRDVPRVTYEDLVWSDQVFGRLGGGYRLTEDIGASLELAAQTNWSSGTNPAGSPVELMGGGWAWVADSLVARGGLAFGLTRSPGAPVTRLVIGLSFEPDPDQDIDHDGIVNRLDVCPDAPEDVDGYSDADGCPDPSFTAEFRATRADGALVNAAVTLEGPDQVSLSIGDRFSALHPGAYKVEVVAEGYLPWSGIVEVPARQGERFTLPLTPHDGTLKVWAIDAAGNAVSGAILRLSGIDKGPANGAVWKVSPGEHAVVVIAPGYVAGAVSVEVKGGDSREVSVTLLPQALPPN